MDALRGTMLANDTSVYGIAWDWMILLLTLIGLILIYGRLYLRAAM
ncbi:MULTISPECIES: hypothetical protein [unclassified Nodularia (in: cyanobacteria)]|nr:hypothetical protein [Nodularia sp. LEGE 06071]